MIRNVMNTNSKSEEEMSRMVRMMKVLAEPNRLALLRKIMDGIQCNCELGGELNLAPNLISHHLGVLRDAGLINLERDQFDARWIYYSINQEALDDYLRLFTEFLNPKRILPRQVSCGPSIPWMTKST
jgi:ArsR family transcriptional regulator